MKIINTELMHENLVAIKNITITETGLMSRFCFNCDTEKAILRIKKDEVVVGEVVHGEYYTSHTDASNELIKADSKGEWEFLVYLLEGRNETKVEVSFETERLPNKIFYGDLHSHSICSSDAVNTFEEIENRVLEIGNDFHAVTDHNSYAMNFQFKNKKSSTEFIYGVEMTNAYGHYNFLGREVPVDICLVDTEQELREKMKHHKENGGYVTFNHPFSPKSRICIIPITKEYCDFVEIWNGPWATHNKIALKWWHKQLLNNVYYPITGGSDTHKIKDERNYGNPVNCVIAPYNEQQVLLSQIKKGHSYLLGTPKIIDIEFSDVIFGDTIEKDKFKIIFKAENDYSMNVITNLDSKTYSIKEMPNEFAMKNYTFVRFEAYDGEECVFVSNPIFSNKF